MHKVAIIPLRAGSKSIIGKNKKRLLGRALYQWTLSEAIFSNLDKIYIFTDDIEIINQVNTEYKWTSKVETILRSPESATDNADTEMAMLELAEKINYNFDIICLIQATSPLTTRYDINSTIEKVENEKFDSALTVVENKRFVWSWKGESLNYDFKNRPRRQDFSGMLIENGAVYVTTKDAFILTRNRLGGKIGIVTMPEDTLVEIDEPNDWKMVAELLKDRLAKQKGEFIKTTHLVLDVDGVFTNGTVAVSADGELFKSFSLRDGMGLSLLHENNIIPIVMTSEDSPIVAQRMNKLKISNLFMGVKDKYARLDQFCKENKIKRNQIAYIGDDINDLCNICSVGYSFTPVDALEEVKLSSDIILHHKGGDKAIRECIEHIIKTNNRY